MPSFPKPGASVRRNPEPTRKEKEAARNAVWARCGGFCEKCGIPVIYERGEWASMHTAHIKGGIHRDDWTPGNLIGACIKCHQVEMHNKKSVPVKGEIHAEVETAIRESERGSQTGEASPKGVEAREQKNDRRL